MCTLEYDNGQNVYPGKSSSEVIMRGGMVNQNINMDGLDGRQSIGQYYRSFGAIFSQEGKFVEVRINATI